MPEMDHDAVTDLRKNIARIELWAEQIEQAMLFEAARAFGWRSGRNGRRRGRPQRNSFAAAQKTCDQPSHFRIAVGRAVDRDRHRMLALTDRKA
jgi:hypothetical protein